MAVSAVIRLIPQIVAVANRLGSARVARESAPESVATTVGMSSTLLPSIAWTAHPLPTAVEPMRVDHRGGHIGVSSEFLHRTASVAVLQKGGGAPVAQAMTGGRRGPRGGLRGFLHRLL